jgi:predicted metalloprotease with PDZ domain
MGDVVLALNGVYVTRVEELTDTMHRYKPGTKVSLRYRRYKTIYDTFVVIGTDRTQSGQTVSKATE